jgi:hypothetical protein
MRMGANIRLDGVLNRGIAPLTKAGSKLLFRVHFYRKIASHFSGRALAGNIEFGPVKRAVGGNCGRDGIRLDWQASANYVRASLAPFV